MPVPARRLLLLPLAISVLALAASAGAAAARRPDRVDRQVVRALNEVRGHYGLAPLRVGRGITRVAGAHSRLIARTGVFSHGNWLAKVARAARSFTVGEVLAYLSGVPARAQARAAIRGWLNSSPHRAVILSPSFHRVGVGRARGRGVTFFTVDVAR